MSKDKDETSEPPAKVKKKDLTNNADKKKDPSLTSETIYKQTVDHEEAEALSRDSSADLNTYMNLCSNLRSQIFTLKADEPQSQSILDNLKREASLSFVMLKKLNRLEKYRLKDSRDTLAAKKSKVDSFNLQLQNLRYEIYHLKKEVVKCLQFRSKDENIDLVDEKSFFREAPEDISRPEVTKSDPHQLKLARLEWELTQRKKLADLCSEVDRENEGVASNINKKRGQLDNLAPLLKQLLSVSKPLIENLSYPENPARSQYKLAHLLPEPLYCLFIQTDAYKQAFFSGIEVKIIGYEDEAEQVNKMITEVANPVDTDSENEEVPNKAEATSSKHRHHHHHSKSQAAQVIVKPGDKVEDKRTKLCLLHPLSIELLVKSSKTSASLTLTFNYLYNLHVVAVKVAKQGIPGPVSGGSSHLEMELLAGLFPEDEKTEEGEVTPNLMNHYQLKQVGLTWDATKLGHPYAWAQRMAGLSFPLVNSPSSSLNTPVTSATSMNRAISQATVPRVIKRLVRRLRSAHDLATLLVQLENGQLMGSHRCSLSSWQSLAWCQYQACDVTRITIASGAVTQVWPLYKAVLARASAKCTAYIAINHEYPVIPPVFNIQIEFPNKSVKTFANDSAVRDIEKELNVHWKEMETEETSILRNQIEHLASCFDIYLECSGLKEFPHKKGFIKIVRGRTRAHPYKCSSKGEGLFTQR